MDDSSLKLKVTRCILGGLLVLFCAQGGLTQRPKRTDSHRSDTATSGERKAQYKSGELIVRFAEPKEEVVIGPLSSRTLRNIVSGVIVPNSSVDKEFDHMVRGLTVVKLPEGIDVESAFLEFNLSGGILYAEPNYRLWLQQTYPNDPLFAAQWALDNSGQTGGTPDADIDAPEAWDIQTGDANVVVAVIDTGIDYNHPDVAANIWINPGEDNPPLGVVDGNDFDGTDADGNGYFDDILGYDFAGAVGTDPGDTDNDPMDVDGHGTHVAGIIGAVGDNDEGIAGVCWNVRLMALKSFADDGEGYDVDAILAIYYAVENGADIINASWGYYDYSQAMFDMVEIAEQEGVLIVASAGNEANDTDARPHYPSGFELDNIISVMATGHRDEVADYSDWGATSIDLAAPGGNIVLNYVEGIYSTVLGGAYDFKQGTSMAAPHVACAAALMLSEPVPTLPHRTVSAVAATCGPLRPVASR